MQSSTFQSGDTALGAATKAGLTPAQFLEYNPDLAATGGPGDSQGLTGSVKPGEAYNTAPPASKIVNTSASSRVATAQSDSALQNVLAGLSGSTTPENPNPDDESNDIEGTANDPFIQQLNTLQTNQDAATKALIASTAATYQNNVNKVNAQYGNYKAGLQQLGLETGEAEATPDLLVGHIQQAANDQMDKINTLQANEQKAIIDANNAKANGDFRTMTARMTYVKNIQTEKAAAIKNMYDAVNSANKEVTYDAPSLYASYSSLTDPNDKKAFIAAVAQQFGTSPISVVSALTGEQAKESKVQLSEDNTKSIIAKRGSTGAAGTSGAMTKAQIAQGEAKLKATEGTDGYVDPYAYAQAYADWKGTTKEFIAAYPPKDYVNPAATNLPSYLMPPKAAKSTGSSSGRSS